MTHFRVASKLVYDEGSEGYIPEITIDYNSIDTISDLVVKENLPPDPNVGVYYVQQDTEDGVVDLIKADSKYGVGAVLLDHDDEGSMPSTTLFNATKDYLIGLGMSQTQADDALETGVAERTRFKISNDLIAWLKANS
jgi:hypothetical protein